MVYNPYAPDGTAQFKLPVRIDDGAKDEHGQLNEKFLNELFHYEPVGNIGDNEKIIDIPDTETPRLSDELKDYLAQAFYYYDAKSLDDFIAFYDDCVRFSWGLFPSCGGLACFLLNIRNKFFKKLDRSSLDTSIALVFGNKTTIGQVCSFARGLEDDTVDDVPGFCCLDAPYESQDWGEKVRPFDGRAY